MTRRTIGLLLTLALGFLVVPVAADAQPPTKVPRIGMVSGSGDPGAWTVEIDAMPPGGVAKAFRQGLRELGYREGETILIERRTAAGHFDRIPGLVTELLHLHVDVLVSGNIQAIRAAKAATTQTWPRPTLLVKSKILGIAVVQTAFESRRDRVHWHGRGG